MKRFLTTSLVCGPSSGCSADQTVKGTPWLWTARRATCPTSSAARVHRCHRRCRYSRVPSSDDRCQGPYRARCWSAGTSGAVRCRAERLRARTSIQASKRTVGRSGSRSTARAHRRAGDHQRPSEAIRGHQRSSEVIRGHRRTSEDIRYSHDHSASNDHCPGRRRACLGSVLG